MNKTALSLCLAGIIALPGLAQARPLTLTAQMKNYSGDGAYLAIYVTDAAGHYQKTLWVSGRKAKYYKHLRDWARGSGMNRAEFDGVSAVIAGSSDWAGAWAVDGALRPMFAVVPGGERQREQAYRFGVNLVMYVLTGNYKADQVHLPTIMERLAP